jgi:hypothetical protein
MGYLKDILQESLESFLEDYWEKCCSDGKPVFYEDCEETYLQSYEAYMDEMADRAKRLPDNSTAVKAKIARVLGIKGVGGARRGNIVDLCARLPKGRNRR